MKTTDLIAILNDPKQREQFPALHQDRSAYITEIITLRKLAGEMEEYADHTPVCRGHGVRVCRLCDCGFSDLAARFDALRKGWE